MALIPVLAGLVGALALAGFVSIERRVANRCCLLDLFRSSQFTGANLTTFAVYFGLGGAIFLLVLHLQLVARLPGAAGGRLPVALHRDHAGALGPHGIPGPAHRAPRLPVTPAGPLVTASAGLVLNDPGRARRRLTEGRPSRRRCLRPGHDHHRGAAPPSAVRPQSDERHVGVASGGQQRRRPAWPGWYRWPCFPPSPASTRRIRRRSPPGFPGPCGSAPRPAPPGVWPPSSPSARPSRSNPLYQAAYQPSPEPCLAQPEADAA